MIDLILRAADKPALAQWAKDKNLIIRKGRVVDEDPDSPTFGDVLEAGEWVNREGFEYCWWAGSGKLMTQAGTYDDEGVELTAPNFLNGVVAIIRIYGGFFSEDKLEVAGDDPDAQEQFARSKVVRFIKDNGTLGSVGAINYYELDGVRIFRPADVQAFLASNGLAGHEWLGGNSY